jgi:hypothetical protein
MFTDANLLRGTYYYTVQTINAVGTGISSLEVNAFAVRELCVANVNTNTVSVLPSSVNMSVTPLRSLANGISGPYAVASDTVHDEIFVANMSGNAVNVYPRTGSSTTASTRSLSGLNGPAALVVDTANDELWVANSNTPSVAVYDRTMLTLKRTIIGSMTQLSSPGGIALDLAHGEIIVLNSGNNSVVPFARTDANNVGPLRVPVIGGSNTKISSASGIAYDATHDQVVVASAGNSSVTSYLRTATGNAYPTWWLQGSSTGLAGPVGVVLDPLASASGELLVINGNGGGSSSVTAYSTVHICGTSPCTTPADDPPSRVINSTSLSGSQAGALCN